MFNLDEYEPVESRIKAFWEKYPDGRLHTELVHFDSSNFIIKAMAFTDRTDTVAAAIDYAHEVVGNSPVNKNFALANGCTSAIGRCLSTLGFSPKGKRPSREEMAKVVEINAIKAAKPLDWGTDDIPLPPPPDNDPFGAWPVEQVVNKISEPNFAPSSDKQVRFLFTLFTKMAAKDKAYLQQETCVSFIEKIVGKRVADYGLLSAKEASAVIKALQKEVG
jgi:hypothetical protein